MFADWLKLGNNIICNIQSQCIFESREVTLLGNLLMIWLKNTKAVSAFA